MTQNEFKSLEAGDVVQFGFSQHVIVEVERYAVSPGVRETVSITVAGGGRMKVGDADVARLIFVRKGEQP
jgi:hypothetical protein